MAPDTPRDHRDPARAVDQVGLPRGYEPEYLLSSFTDGIKQLP
jgi:hypothetical protein